jgi:hypothetical protein
MSRHSHDYLRARRAAGGHKAATSSTVLPQGDGELSDTPLYTMHEQFLLSSLLG